MASLENKLADLIERKIEVVLIEQRGMTGILREVGPDMLVITAEDNRTYCIPFTSLLFFILQDDGINGVA